MCVHVYTRLRVSGFDISVSVCEERTKGMKEQGREEMQIERKTGR